MALLRVENMSHNFGGLRAVNDYNLEIEPPEGSGLPIQTISDVEVNKDMHLDITLKSGIALSGKVIDPNGKPVANAYVTATNMMASPSVDQVTTP